MQIRDSHGAERASSGGGVSRRAVVRTGANLAWAVPAVVAVTAAPALAVSGPAKLKISHFSATYNPGGDGFTCDLGPVTNTGGSDAGQLKAVITVPKLHDGPFSVAPTFRSLTGPWVYAGRTGTGPWSYTFVSDDPDLQPGEKTGELVVHLKLNAAYKKAVPHPRISVNVMGNNCSASASDPV